MNKFQKAFNKLGVDLETIINKYTLTSTEVNKIKKQYKIIQELIDQQSDLTLEKCIEKWEEKGWTMINKEQTELYLIKCDHRCSPVYYLSFYIRKEIQFSTNCPINKELLDLLSKTLKVLKVKR